MSNNIALTTLHYANNHLTSLDASNNTALTKLNCNDNRLTSLDASYCTPLIRLLLRTISMGTDDIIPHIVKQHCSKKLLSTAHGPRLRYTSSNNSVATVSKAAVLHAKKKGNCVICVRALNGISKQIKVKAK